MQIVGMVGRTMKAVIYGHKHEFCVLTKIQGVSHRNLKKGGKQVWVIVISKEHRSKTMSR